MIPNQAKKRSPDELVLATFRIPYEKWEKFQEAASRAGTTASTALLTFIEGYLAESPVQTDAKNNADLPKTPLEPDLVEPTESQTVTKLEDSDVSEFDRSFNAQIEQKISELVDLKLDAIATQLIGLTQRLDRIEHKADRRNNSEPGQPSEVIEVDVVAVDAPSDSNNLDSDRPLDDEFDPETLAGLSQTALCTEFGINPTNLNRHAIRRGLSTAEYLHQLTGWIYRNGKYYPPES